MSNCHLLKKKKGRAENQGNWGSVPCPEWSVSCQNDLYYAMIELSRTAYNCKHTCW